MEENDIRDKFSIEERISLIDKTIKSPGKRTNKVWNILVSGKNAETITDWDMICFCSAYLLQQAKLLYPWLYRDETKMVNKLIFQAHYRMTEELHLGDSEPTLRKKE